MPKSLAVREAATGARRVEKQPTGIWRDIRAIGRPENLIAVANVRMRNYAELLQLRVRQNPSLGDEQLQLQREMEDAAATARDISNIVEIRLQRNW